jgi:hypothetical protein
MRASAAALRFVLEQGVPAAIEVAGASMEPTIAKGAKVRVAACASGDDPRVGEIVLLATEDDGVVLLHRLMGLFDDAGRPSVLHIGDAPDSLFGVVPRTAVLGRMVGFEPPDERPVPTIDRLEGAARARAIRLLVYASAFMLARRASAALGLARQPFARAVWRRLRAVIHRRR